MALRLTPVEKIELHRGYDQTVAGLQDLLWVVDTKGRVDEPEVYQDERQAGSDFDDGESGDGGSILTRLSRRGSRASRQSGDSKGGEGSQKSAAESSDSEDAMLKRIQEANKRLAALAAGEVVDEEPVKKPPRRVKTLRDIPIYDRPFAGEPFPRERDARGRKIPTRKTRVTKDDAPPPPRAPKPPPHFRPKPMLLKVFALSHGIRPLKGQTMVRAINAYLARPGAVILSPLEAKARLTQLSTSKFPTVPFTIVPGSHPCCTGGWLLQGMQFSLANYRQLGLLSWFLLIVVYYGSVGVAGVADGSIPAASYTSVSCAILILILLLITVLAFRSMKRSGPPPLYLLDLSPVMKLVCLFLVSDLVLRTREPITVTGEFSPSYNVIAVCGHMGALFVLSYPLVLSVWLNKDSFKPVAKFYYWAFWFGWLDFAFSMGTALSYGGSSFNTTRVLYFSLGVVLSLALWVLPLLTSLPEGLRGAALQTGLVALLVDLPLVIVSCLDEHALKEPFIFFDMVFKSGKVLQAMALVHQSVAAVDAELMKELLGLGADDDNLDFELEDEGPQGRCARCQRSCRRRPDPNKRTCGEQWRNVCSDTFRTCMWSTRRTPAADQRKENRAPTAWADPATIETKARPDGAAAVPVEAGERRMTRADRLREELKAKKRERLEARRLVVYKLKAAHEVHVTRLRRLARRGSSLESDDSLSDSAEWSEDDERRATLPVATEEFIQCVIRDEGDGRDPPDAPPSPPSSDEDAARAAVGAAHDGASAGGGSVGGNDGDMKAAGDDSLSDDGDRQAVDAGSVEAQAHEPSEGAGYHTVWPPHGSSSGGGAETGDGPGGGSSLGGAGAPAPNHRVVLPPLARGARHAPSPPPHLLHRGDGAPGDSSAASHDVDDVDAEADAAAAAALEAELLRQRAEARRAQSEQARLLLDYLYPRSDTSLAAEHGAFTDEPSLLLR